jgi:hypothetical protein
MDALLALATVLVLFILVALPSLVGLALEYRVTRQIRAAAARRDDGGTPRGGGLRGPRPAAVTPRTRGTTTTCSATFLR